MHVDCIKNVKDMQLYTIGEILHIYARLRGKIHVEACIFLDFYGLFLK